jgi:hypothetical protein
MKRTTLSGILTLVAVLATTFAVAGCGGESGSSSTSSSPAKTTTPTTTTTKHKSKPAY